MAKESTEPHNLTLLKSEQEQARNRLKQQIAITRNIIDNLEAKLDSDDAYISASSGLQGNSGSIDGYLNQYIAYSRAIVLFEREFKKKGR